MAGHSLVLKQISLILLIAHYVWLLEDPLVKTRLGMLRGHHMTTENNKEFLAFRSIPYASPPVGDRRFALPLPIKPWTGVLNVTSDGHQCMQGKSLASLEKHAGDEDCLYLNVYIPEGTINIKQEPYPVMVYIHGGGFTTGSGTFKDYGPQRFMDTSKVIVVTINFRLGVFGFLSTEDKNSAGNYGLWDQIMALKWVQNNIANFGGDPKLVTIFGSSSGAGSVSLHLLSPHSKNLFSGAICQSGTAVSDRTLQVNPLDQAKQLANNLNCPTDSTVKMVECLKEKPALEILKNGVLNENSSYQFRFWPVVDKTFGDPVFLDDLPSVLFGEHRVNVVPVISGVNKDEGVHYYVQALIDNDAFEQDDLFNVTTLRQIATAISTDLMSDNKNGSQLYNELIDDYFNDVNTSDVKQVIQALSLFVTDSKTCIYVDFTNKMLQEAGVPVYVYKLTHRGDHTYMTFHHLDDYNLRTLEELGIVVHVDELQYFWHCAFKPTTMNAIDKRMSEIMLALWTSFAKTRIPSFGWSSNDVDLYWQPIASGHYSYLNLSLYPQMVKGELTSKPELWEESLEAAAVDCRIWLPHKVKT